MRAHLARSLAGLISAALLSACPSPPSADAGPAAPILDPAHLGWKSQDCPSCHELPLPEHAWTKPPDCAACHGGNGACDPTSPGVSRTHAHTDDCVSCHIENHSFDLSASCRSCHFAAAGLHDCSPVMPDAGADSDAGTDTDAGDNPHLSSTLTHGCFDWPNTAFSSGNSATVRTFVNEGTPAIEFTLTDVDGTPFTLSSLLRTRPVLLVFGSFT